jgi:hypothetical protein
MKQKMNQQEFQNRYRIVVMTAINQPSESPPLERLRQAYRRWCQTLLFCGIPYLVDDKLLRGETTTIIDEV